MTRSRLINRGQESATFYPSVPQINRLGVKVLAPGDVGVTQRVTVASDRQATAELPGQVYTKVVRIITAPIEGLDAESRTFFRGEWWDMAQPPHHSSGASRATRHVELLLRSRNGAP